VHAGSGVDCTEKCVLDLGKSVEEGEGIPDVEDVEPDSGEDIIRETMFTFETFEAVSSRLTTVTLLIRSTK
jgi:hypothetical protein